jgi:hypothetical protein
MTLTMYESDQDNPFRKAIQAVLAAAPDYSPTETPAMRRRDAALGDMVTAEIIPCIFRIMNTSAATARTLQGMAPRPVRAGSCLVPRTPRLPGQ